MLIADNPAQKEELLDYRATYNRLYENLQSQIEDPNGFSPAKMILNKPMMDEIRRHQTNVIARENNLLLTRRAEEQKLQKNFIATLLTTAALSALGLLLGNGAIAYLTYRRKFAEDDLRRANKEMEGFTFIASHDLRSPLVNLKGFSTEMKYSIDELVPLLESNRAGIDEADYEKISVIVNKDLPDSLKYIHSSVEKMDKLTNSILELSRIGRRNMALQTVSPETIVRHILDTLHHSITSQKIEVTVLPMPPVTVDPLLIEQIFSNIIDNAIKYTDASRPGKIEIGSSKSYRETKFWIKDNGRGIAAADFQKIFEIYRRAGNTDTIPGEGMGMAYVRATLRRLGGQIWVESTPGLGTTFYFTISNTLKKDRVT
jgi:signal transduction histidine kinase